MTKVELDEVRVWLIRDFLSGAECDGLIRRSENLTYHQATLGNVVVKGYRDNDRVIHDDPALAAELFTRAEPFLPRVIDSLRLAGFSERFRFYRYGPGQAFAPHPDGTFERLDVWEESRVTFLVYLNDGADGGETCFFATPEEAARGEPYLSVTPERGAALAFLHRIWHEGVAVRAGVKYVMRTDVMFRGPPVDG